MRSALPLTVAAVMLAAPVLAQNLAPNPGFEDGEGDLPAGWRLEAVHPLAVPGLRAERHLVVVGRAAPGGA